MRTLILVLVGVSIGSTAVLFWKPFSPPPTRARAREVIAQRLAIRGLECRGHGVVAAEDSLALLDYVSCLERGTSCKSETQTHSVVLLLAFPESTTRLKFDVRGCNQQVLNELVDSSLGEFRPYRLP
jgi:hypothetical protein